MNINSGNAKLVLLCPVWKKWGTVRTVKSGSVILHSRADDGLSSSVQIEVGMDHRLADPEPLKIMLWACEAVE